MNVKNFIFNIVSIAFCFSFENAIAFDEIESLCTSITAIEKESNEDKANKLRSLAKINIQYLEARSNEKIRITEKKLAKYKEMLQHCNNGQQIQDLLDKIKSAEEKINLLREFQSNLFLMKSSQ